jgi:uncharacterized membrane protein
MSPVVNFWPLLGVAAVAVGFVLRLNPMLIVLIGAVGTGVAAQLSATDILTQIGTGFIKYRNLPLITLLPLPVIGLLERHGLREFVQSAIAKVRTASAGRLLILYLFVREVSAGLGLVSLGGHVQMVRPLIAPMAEAAAEKRYGGLGDLQRFRIRAMAAATDNIGLFFGEDVFVAFGTILFMQNTLRTLGIEAEPIQMALWGIPTAVCAFLIHAFRLHRLDSMLARESPARENATRESPG